MNGFSIAGLLFVAIPSIIVGPFVLFKGRKKIHVIWAAFLTSVALWGFGMMKIGMSTEPEKSLFWWRIAEIGVILIPVFLVHFVISFLELRRRAFLALFYLATLALLYCDLFTDYFINKLYFAFGQFYYIQWTPLYSVFIFVFIASVVYVVAELYRAYRKSSDVKRHQIRYLMLAFVVGFSGGLSSYFPVYGIAVYPVWNGTIFVSVLAVAYAILKYRLMDLRLFFKRFFIYSLSSIFIYGAFYFTLWFYEKFSGGVFSTSSYILGFAAAPIFTASFFGFNAIVRKFADKYFFTTLYNYQKELENLSQKLNYINNLDEITDLIIKTVKESLQINDVAVLLAKSQGGQQEHFHISGFDAGIGGNLLKDRYLLTHLLEKQKPLVGEEIFMESKACKDAGEKGRLLELYKKFKKEKVYLCLPLICNARLIGLIALGSKSSEDAFTKEEIDLLSVLAYQAGMAIDSAKLYKEIQDLNVNLQKKVDEQTEDIRKAYESEKKAKEMIDAIRVEDEALLGSIADGVMAINKEGKVMFMNQVAEEMLGCKRSDAINRPYEKVLCVETEAGEAIPKENNLLQLALMQGKKFVIDGSNPGTVRYYRRSDGSRFPAAVTVAPVVLGNITIGAVDVFRDITIQRQIDKSKSEFVSLASHQLRTPLSAIKWYSEMILSGRGGKLTLKQKKWLDEVHKGNERMIKLIGVLLDVSHLEAGKMRHEPASINVNQLVENVIGEQKFAIKSKKQKLSLKQPDEELGVFADPTMLRMVFQNIISNAVKYTPDGGKISCLMERQGDNLFFKVQDTGIGIPKEQQGRVFQKLFRASNAQPHDPEGNGLGLYVAKVVVEGLQGKIWFDSAEKEGTTFFIVLPLEKNKE